MNSSIQVKKVNGEVINAELISYFEITTTGKKYLFYTLNEIVENNLVKMYVSEVSNDNNLSDRMSEEDWNNLKNIMKLILTGNKSDNIKYLKWEG